MGKVSYQPLRLAYPPGLQDGASSLRKCLQHILSSYYVVWLHLLSDIGSPNIIHTDATVGRNDTNKNQMGPLKHRNIGFMPVG